MKQAQQRPPRSYQDLMAVTGLGREAVKAAIQRGELPGYLIGSRYVVPADAFDAFCAGTWQPQPRPLAHRPMSATGQLVRRRSTTGSRAGVVPGLD